jgi:hypothetical protein
VDLVSTRTVAVQFVDASTGQCFARSDVPVEQLPATFAVDTTLTLAGESWSVLQADPPTAAEFRTKGLLTLTLSRVRSVSAHDILYSLPTLYEGLPVVDPARARLDLLQLHEDDWRQVELVSPGLADVVASELAAVRRVYDEHAVTGADGGVIGFRDVHVRSRPEAPLIPALPRATILLALPAHHTFAGVGFANGVGIAVDSFAFRCGPISFYGLGAGETITVLGLQIGRARSTAANDAAAGLEGIMRTFTLTLVDWCRCTVVDADSVGSYFEAMG